MLLTEQERATAADDVGQLILASSQTVMVQRIVPGERLCGSDHATCNDIGERSRWNWMKPL